MCTPQKYIYNIGNPNITFKPYICNSGTNNNPCIIIKPNCINSTHICNSNIDICNTNCTTKYSNKCCNKCISWPCKCCNKCTNWPCKCCNKCANCPCKCCHKCTSWPCKCCHKCTNWPCKCCKKCTNWPCICVCNICNYILNGCKCCKKCNDYPCCCKSSCCNKCNIEPCCCSSIHNCCKKCNIEPCCCSSMHNCCKKCNKNPCCCSFINVISEDNDICLTWSNTFCDICNNNLCNCCISCNNYPCECNIINDCIDDCNICIDTSSCSICSITLFHNIIILEDVCPYKKYFCKTKKDSSIIIYNTCSMIKCDNSICAILPTLSITPCTLLNPCPINNYNLCDKKIEAWYPNFCNLIIGLPNGYDVSMVGSISTYMNIIDNILCEILKLIPTIEKARDLCIKNTILIKLTKILQYFNIAITNLIDYIATLTPITDMTNYISLANTIISYNWNTYVYCPYIGQLCALRFRTMLYLTYI